ncbi:MAG: winged helix-turn-helix transcriptional regulator [Thaumarchaeota archaeon]|nr:MAG: winged helix-turn-helix transcriptional regulator [Nitrososphaerota archaeon]
MGSPWKALSDDNRRQILSILKEKDMIPTEIAEHYNFTLPGVSVNLRILKDADLITEKKQGRYRLYSLNKKARFFDDMYDYKLKSLKEYVENKERRRKK